MNAAKDKDRILAEIKACNPLIGIEGLPDVIRTLESDGMIDVLYDEERKPIRVRITQTGEAFIANGGHAGMRTRIAKCKTGAFVARISEAVIIALLSGC